MYEGGTRCSDTLSVIDAMRCDAQLAFTYPDDRARWTNHEVEYYSESLDGAKKEFHGGFLQIDLDAMVCVMCIQLWVLRSRTSLTMKTACSIDIFDYRVNMNCCISC